MEKALAPRHRETSGEEEALSGEEQAPAWRINFTTVL
jgi:hypothetical protein